GQPMSRPMCGRVIQSIPPIRCTLLQGTDVRDSRVHNYRPRWDAAPSQEPLVIRRKSRSLRWASPRLTDIGRDPRHNRATRHARGSHLSPAPYFLVDARRTVLDRAPVIMGLSDAATVGNPASNSKESRLALSALIVPLINPASPQKH